MKARVGSQIWVLLLAPWGLACEPTETPALATDISAAGTYQPPCIDDDGDSFGEYCDAGGDCNDMDPDIHTGCRPCSLPAEGCPCEAGSPPVTCTDNVQLEGHTLLCDEGTRFCRDGAYTACLGLGQVAVKSSEIASTRRALVPPDAGSGEDDWCSPCNRACFEVEDPLDPAEGGLDNTNSEDVVFDEDTGAITLEGEPGGPSTVPPPIAPEDCVLGSAPDVDCDGIPDVFDDTDGAIFETTNDSVFMDLEPGETETAEIDLRFFLNTADIYFLVDQTASMAEERAALIADLTTGDHFADSAGVECADTDFDGTPNNELKAGGVVGNISCLIRGAYTGTGWYRDVPFYGLGFSDAYGDNDEFAFEHVQDITGVPSQTQSAFNGFETNSTRVRPEAGGPALHALVTGEQLYFGWDRPAVPPRVGCPEGTWGYACFRDEAMPIVVLISDVAHLGGPDLGDHNLNGGAWGDYDLNYPAMALSEGSDARYNPVTGNDSFASAEVITEPIDTVFRTFTGDTRGMTEDLSSEFECLNPGELGHADVLYRFTVADGDTDLTFTTQGSRIDTALAIFSAAEIDAGVTPPQDLTVGVQGDGTGFALGQLGVGGLYTLTGSTASLSGDLPLSDLSCTSGDEFSPDALFAFTLPRTMTLTFDTGGSAFDTMLGLYAGRPATRTVLPISGGNDEPVSADTVGTLDGQDLLGTGGDLGAMTPTYGPAPFAVAGCSPDVVTGSANDAFFDFELLAPTSVRVEVTDAAGSTAVPFDHALAIIDRDAGGGAQTGPTSTQQVPVTPANDDDDSVYSIGAVDGGWTQVTGNSAGLGADIGQFFVGGMDACGAGVAGGNSATDAVFSFSLSSPRRLSIDTIGSDYETFLSLHDGRAAPTLETVAHDRSAESAASAQDLGDITGRFITVTGGDTRGMTSDYDSWDTSRYTCNDGSTFFGLPFISYDPPDTVFKVTLSEPGRINTWVRDMDDALLSVSVHQLGSAADLSDDTYLYCRGGQGQSGDLDAGEYYVVVSGASRDDAGRFVLDISSVPSTLVACDNGSAPTVESRSQLQVDLDAGDYRLVLKGDGVDAASSDYVINIRDLDQGAGGSFVACDFETAARGAELSPTLPEGSYTAVVRGATPGDAGGYGIRLRDLNQVSHSLACDDDSGIGTTSRLTVTLPATDSNGDTITYYAGLRGWSSGDAGDYTLRIEHDLGGNVLCDDDGAGGTYGWSRLNTRLSPGDYYLAVKGVDNGRNDAHGTPVDTEGWYQVTMGDATLAAPGSLQMPNWLGEGGAPSTLAALSDRGVRVITVRAGDNAEAEAQNDLISAQTGAVDENSVPLQFRIGADGDGLGEAIVRGIEKLTEQVSVDVGVRLVEAPDDPTPDFEFSVRALEQPGDGCDGPVVTTARGPMHTDCGPGATPRFEVSFTNPAAAPVPVNPADPYGGYHMQLEMFSQDDVVSNPTSQPVVVDRVPVYIIPSDVIQEADEVYPESGSYWQQFSALACDDTERPIWEELSWDASLPEGTSVEFWVCTADEAADLDAACAGDPRHAGTITYGGACVDHGGCGRGFCVGGQCHAIQGPPCEVDQDCGTNGRCATTCYWDVPSFLGQQPDPRIDLTPALSAGDNGAPASRQALKHMRVRLVLNANEDLSAAPSVFDWAARFTCSPAE